MDTLSRCGFFLMVSLLFLLTISPTQSYAWSCSNSTEPKDLFKENDSVFIGTVITSSNQNVGSMNPKSRTTFEVASLLKGNNKNNITVVTTVGSDFLKGKEYLVYAYQTTKDNYLYKYEEGELAVDTWCGGTKELSLADYDLEQITEWKDWNEKVQFVMIPLFFLFVMIAVSVKLKRR